MVNTQNKPLAVELLSQQLSQLSAKYNIKTWCLAYSGGVDSQVLLHLLQLTKLNITAVYIDHGLQPESSSWADHCQQQCDEYNIPFQAISVNASPAKSEGPEAAARKARYGALKNVIEENFCLLTAQHQDDQSETVLLQLLRGAGAAGLSAMPMLCEFGRGFHARPLLGISQQSILDYARENNLSWVEDPSNQRVNYDRNYLRQQVIPEIKKRWPALDKTLSVFARQQAENIQLLCQLAEMDLALLRQGQNSLDINALKCLDESRLRNVLRYWFKTLQSPIPSRAQLQQIIRQIANPSHDSHALVSWAGVEVRRFRDRLFWLKKIAHDASQIFLWDGKSALNLASIEATIRLKSISKAADPAVVLDSSILNLPLSIRFRQGGEKFKPQGRGGSHSLKALFQEADIPTWQRDRVPLLYAGEELIAIGDRYIADKFALKDEGLMLVIT